ncbi:MAG: sulfatase-like hydrolase/transferase [Treponema sp.]|nr:sulfatase-like hydrolase/transferase [Treponema sp.]
MNRRPNVIVFFTDQQRWDTMGVYRNGNSPDLTPNLDRMAMEGTHCYSAFTCQPVCVPARAALQTGKYPTNTGFRTGKMALGEEHKTLGYYFKQSGYTTGYIGKWHLAMENPVPPEFRCGYDYWLGSNVLEHTSNEYSTYVYDNEGKEIFLPGYRADAIADAGIRYVTANRDRPFFLFMSFIEPHFQNSVDDFPPPVGYREKYEGRWLPADLQSLGGSSARHLGGYCGMAKRLDEALGRLNDALISMDLLDNTIILFTTDHGCHFKTRNGEYKRSCHESSIRIPMVLTGPGFNGGGRIRDLVSLIDMPPTLLDAAGLPIPPVMEGRSILDGRKDWPDDVFVQITESNHYGRAVRTKRWKYSVDTAAAETDYESYDRNPVYTEKFLYDLEYDPHELRNLIGLQSHAGVAALMRERLLRRIEKIENKKAVIIKAPEIPSGQRRVMPEETLQ